MRIKPNDKRGKEKFINKKHILLLTYMVMFLYGNKKSLEI